MSKSMFVVGLILTLAMAGPALAAQAASPGPPGPVAAAAPPPPPPPAAAGAQAAVVVEAPEIKAETGFGTMLLADQLTYYLRAANILAGRRLAALPFFDLGDLQSTTDLGRVVAEELASALHFRNFHLAEIRTDDQVILSRWVGESYLTRTGPDRSLPSVAVSVEGLQAKHNLGGLVVGTYAVLPRKSLSRYEKKLVGGQVSLNARVIDPRTGAVLAVGSAKIEIDETVEALLKRRNSPVAVLPGEEIKAKRF